MVKKSGGPQPVSANNPCPFLRALVSMGKLSDDRERLAKVADVVAATARAGEAFWGVAAVAGIEAYARMASIGIGAFMGPAPRLG